MRMCGAVVCLQEMVAIPELKQEKEQRKHKRWTPYE